MSLTDGIFSILLILAITAAASTAIVEITVSSVRRSMRTASRKVRQIMFAGIGSPTSEIARFPELSNHQTLNGLWSEYLNALKAAKVPQAVKIEDYINYRNLFKGNTALPVAELMPAVLSAMGMLVSVMLLMMGHFKNEAVDIKSLYPAVEGVVLGLLFMLFQRGSCTSTQREITRFTDSVHHYTKGSLSGTDVMLSELTFAIREQNALQEQFYEKMTQKTSEKFAESVVPILQEMEKRMESFITAATDRQAEGMAYVAELFVSSINASVAEHYKNLGKVVSRIVQIQEEYSGTFENMAKISAASTENLIRIQDSTDRIFIDFGSYLDKLGSMSDAIASNMKTITAINNYMKENAQTQSDTIKTLSNYERELSQVSGMYVETMQNVVVDIKDQFSSSMIALRAAAGDMVKAGDYLRSAHHEFSSATVTDIEQIFRHFDENLAGISEHLARNIRELQIAVDELPMILKSIRVEQGV